MTRLLTLLIPCLTLAAFLGLAEASAEASYAKYPPPTAVTLAEKRALASKRDTLPVKLWKHDAAAQSLAQVYGITPQNLNSYRRWW